MAEPKQIEGRKPERETPTEKIGELELANEEASRLASPFWVKCWSCQKGLARPLSPPSAKEAYTCPNCGAVNMIE